MPIKFSEYRPSAPLRNLIQTYWTGDFNLYSEKNFLQSVVPNGCVELIIHLTNAHCELVKESTWGKSPEFTLIGLQTKLYEVRFSQLVQVFGIRFNPEGVYSLFGVPPSHFTFTFENTKDVLGLDFNDYCSRLRACKNLQERINLTDLYLLNKLSKRSPFLDYVGIASDIIRKCHGLIRMEELIRQVPISPRQLQREFKSKLGITAKEYMRITRLNAIQKYLQQKAVNFTELTYENGFADQSHFIKEFRLFTGTNPREFLKAKENFIVNPANSDLKKAQR